MCELIDARSRFRREATLNKRYIVRKADEYEGYLLLKLSIIGKERTCLMAAIPLQMLKGETVDTDDILSLQCSGRLYKPTMRHSPHIILQSFEKMQGEVRPEHRKDFISCIYTDDPKHPFVGLAK